ncbi:hypothetical protein B0H14DRAFT_2592243 [Mycena olivaceomarginata]|nr:hypothetical protein B0H14DRAFT_2608146 [Mycena olivaceomarginata]KAJ7832156.1 hypothetical protein B0H14DRAFT_2592243 [Mycena olivaceomarginata]
MVVKHPWSTPPKLYMIPIFTLVVLGVVSTRRGLVTPESGSNLGERKMLLVTEDTDDTAFRRGKGNFGSRMQFLRHYWSVLFQSFWVADSTLNEAAERKTKGQSGTPKVDGGEPAKRKASSSATQ